MGVGVGCSVGLGVGMGVAVAAGDGDAVGAGVDGACVSSSVDAGDGVGAIASSTSQAGMSDNTRMIARIIGADLFINNLTIDIIILPYTIIIINS